MLATIPPTQTLVQATQRPGPTEAAVPLTEARFRAILGEGLDQHRRLLLADLESKLSAFLAGSSAMPLRQVAVDMLLGH